MDSIKKIIKLSKSTALSLLNEKKVHASDIDNLFSKEETKNIVENLTDPEIKKERDKIARSLNKSKNQDWLKVKPIHTPKNSQNPLYTFYKVAAVLLISLSVSYFYFENDKNLKKNSINSTVVDAKTKSENIILELDNGNKEVIAADGSKTILDKEGKVVGVQNGTNLNYSNKEKEKIPERLVYNKLTIPFGKVFQIVLSDGTKVHLNAGSSLRYPVHFIKGKNRMVFLEGEAYFDVEKNPKQPFIVNTDNMNIEVLGTKFNVSSYPEDSSINTVLVEGSVSIGSSDTLNLAQNILLKPGNKADWKKQNGKVNIKPVDTAIYTAWIDGKIVFEHMKFENILKKLERHYNVSINNTNTTLSRETFTASFDIETIEQVLTSFSKNYQFNFEIKENHITIN